MISELDVASGKPLYQDTQSKANLGQHYQKTSAAKTFKVAAKKSEQFPLPPAGMISKMISHNSISHKRRAEDRKPSEKMRMKLSQSTPQPCVVISPVTEISSDAANVPKAGTLVNTLFTSNNWGSRK